MLELKGQSGGVVGALLLTVVAATAGCGGASGGGGGSADAPPGASTETPPQGDTGGALDTLPSTFESDLRDARVPACQKAQLFALETCWDRVVWSEHGDLALEGAAGRLEVVGKGGAISPRVAPLYQFAADKGGNTRVVSDRLDALRKANPMRGYWFLPTELITAAARPGRPASAVVLQDGEFSLGSWAFAAGTANICGQALAMPLTQGAVEAACQVQAGDAYEWILKSPEAFVHLKFYGNTWDKAPGLLQRRTVGAIRIVRRYPADGGAS